MVKDFRYVCVCICVYIYIYIYIYIYLFITIVSGLSHASFAVVILLP